MRRTYLMICFLIFLLDKTLAQFASVSYSENFTGRNIKIGYQHNHNDFGLKYHFNGLDYIDSRGFAHLRKFYSTSKLNSIGLFCTLRKPLKKIENNGMVYGFFSADINQLSTRFEMYSQVGIDTNQRPVYYFYDYTTPKFLSIEGNLGLGYQLNISPKLTVFSEVGGGLIYIRQKGFIVKTNTSQTLVYFEGKNGIDLWAFQARVGLLMKIK